MKDWANKRVDNAAAANKLVGTKTVEQFKTLLGGKLSEGELRPKELSDLANSILKQSLSDLEGGDEN